MAATAADTAATAAATDTAGTAAAPVTGTSPETHLLGHCTEPKSVSCCKGCWEGLDGYLFLQCTIHFDLLHIAWTFLLEQHEQPQQQPLVGIDQLKAIFSVDHNQAIKTSSRQQQMLSIDDPAGSSSRGKHPAGSSSRGKHPAGSSSRGKHPAGSSGSKTFQQPSLLRISLTAPRVHRARTALTNLRLSSTLEKTITAICADTQP